MKLVVWSDLQIDFSNIAECQTAFRELLRTAKREKPDAIINCGDVKNEYSPISQSVIKEAVRQVKVLRKLGFRYIVVKGNHDRESQSPEAEDWLSVLRAAGAEIVTEPRALYVGDVRIAFLPFIADKAKLIAAAKTVSGEILFFHNEILGSTPGKSGVTLEELEAEHYAAVFGGHIHNHQKIGRNAWYIGSPFTHDWSEANYNKGHLVIEHIGEDESVGYRGGITVRQVITAIPHWYDAEFLAKHKIHPETGAYVRSKIIVSTKKISDQLQAEETRLLKKYGSVRVYTVPELENVVSDELVLSGVSDKEKVAQYVSAKMPDSARFKAGAVISYMAGKLEGMKEHLAAQSLRFEFVRASNVLTFADTVKLRLANRGLVLIKGKAGRRSNGAGKTSLLSLIAPIPLFGLTLKNQKSDEWAHERNTETAESYLRLTDQSGRKVEIHRQRRPHALRLKINEVDKSSGLRGNTKKVGDTQGRIERVTGFDLHSFTSAVYIDQSIANGFVFGSATFRLQLLQRLLNLERYEAALKLVTADIKYNAIKLLETTMLIEGQESRLEEEREKLESLSTVKETQWATKLVATKVALDKEIEFHAAKTAAARTYGEMQDDLDDLNRDLETVYSGLARKAASIGAAQVSARTAQGLVAAHKCPVCGQEAVAVGNAMLRDARALVAALGEELKVLQASKEKLVERKNLLAKKLDAYEMVVEKSKNEISTLRHKIAEYEEAEAAETSRNDALEQERDAVLSRLHTAQRLLQAARGIHKSLSVDRELLEFAKKAFHRSGMPIYLSMALCPVLNSAAEEFSDIFTDGRLKVNFKVENGEFDVDVVNPTGSQTVKGQSVGEAAMAGIIAAFALREAAPKTNLLVLDEPGHGLDQEGARLFARGLLKLRDRYETILLVTHSPAIESVLAGEHLWMVEKSGGKSTLTIVN